MSPPSGAECTDDRHFPSAPKDASVHAWGHMLAVAATAAPHEEATAAAALGKTPAPNKPSPASASSAWLQVVVVAWPGCLVFSGAAPLSGRTGCCCDASSCACLCCGCDAKFGDCCSDGCGCCGVRSDCHCCGCNWGSVAGWGGVFSSSCLGDSACASPEPHHEEKDEDQDGATTRTSNRPGFSLSCPYTRSTKPPFFANKPASTALSNASRTRAWSCTCTPRRPASLRPAYSAASAGTTAGSHASEACMKAGAFAKIRASSAKNCRTATSTSAALNGKKGTTSVRRPRSSLSRKKLSLRPMRAFRSSTRKSSRSSRYSAQSGSSLAAALCAAIMSLPKLLVNTKVALTVETSRPVRES
mmetsp:Transcript_65609/g.182472  ORF Transcript_65609/g.182472 Transcript_65609/m.182472 type:complete len:359 (-) Transcript_65609:2102-3178(-)